MTLQPGIAFLQEPYTAYGRTASIPRGLSLHAFAGTDPPRAAILAPRYLQALTVEHLCTKDSAAVTFRLHGRTVLAVSIYMDSTLPVLQQCLLDSVDFADRRDLPLLICVDTNCHSVLYGESTNARGEEFELFLLQNGLDVQNRGTQPTFEVVRAGVRLASCIDVTLTKRLDVQN